MESCMCMEGSRVHILSFESTRGLCANPRRDIHLIATSNDNHIFFGEIGAHRIGRGHSTLVDLGIACG
jgi:hypothetical protein